MEAMEDSKVYWTLYSRMDDPFSSIHKKTLGSLSLWKSDKSNCFQAYIALKKDSCIHEFIHESCYRYANALVFNLSFHFENPLDDFNNVL